MPRSSSSRSSRSSRAVRFWNAPLLALLVRYLRGASWLHVHASVVEVSDNLPGFLRECGPWILRSSLCCRRSTGYSWILWEVTSELFPCSAQFLVRQWIRVWRPSTDAGWTNFPHVLSENGFRILRSMSPSVASPEEFRKWISLGVDFRMYFRRMLGRAWIQVCSSVWWHGEGISTFPAWRWTSDPEVRVSSCTVPVSTADPYSASVWRSWPCFLLFLREGGTQTLKSFLVLLSAVAEWRSVHRRCFSCLS